MILVDLDPRAASTKWFGVTPEGGTHVGAILTDPAPEGWADDLALPTTWNENLRMIPSEHPVAHREAEKPDGEEAHLRATLQSTTVERHHRCTPTGREGSWPSKL